MRLFKFLKLLYQRVAEAVRIFISAGMVVQGAALAYYTFFAVAPLLIVALAIAGIYFGQQAASKELFNQINGLVGNTGGQAIREIVIAAAKPKNGFFATSLTTGALIFGAAGVFVQLQNSLNLIWQVRLQQGRTLRSFIRHRFLSFAMVLGVGFLLLVSLLLSASLAVVGGFLGSFISERAIVIEILNLVFSLGIITVLFALIFKFLPDVRVAWRSVWLGGFCTAVLFAIGKFVLGIYLGHSALASIYGTMGSLVILLLWVYYSAQILFFGAALTRVIAMHSDSPPQPLSGSEFIAGSTVKQIRQPDKTLAASAPSANR